MARGKVQIRRIDNDVSRRTSFAKRRAGLLKKAHELAVLCDAHLGVIVFSDAGQLFDYCSPHTSWTELIQRYESITNAQLQETDDDDYGDQQMFMDITATNAWLQLQRTNPDEDAQMFTEIAALRRERDRLVASLRRLTGEDLPSGATREELGDLEQQLELALGKVRQMKDKLVDQQLDESHRKVHILGKVRQMKDKIQDQQLDESHNKVHILEDQNSFLRHTVTEDGQHRAAADSAVVMEGMTVPELPFGGFFPEVEEHLSTSLQLWPQQLPDVHGFGLQPSGPSLRLQ